MPGENVFKNLIRIGEVSSIDAVKHTARVRFPSLGDMVSAPLYVLQHKDMAVSMQNAGVHDHEVSGQTGAGGDPSHAHSFSDTTTEAGEHTHDAVTGYWMPKVNDTVVCLYVPVDDGDGFILGGL